MQTVGFRDSQILLTSVPICVRCDQLLKLVDLNLAHPLPAHSENGCHGEPFRWPMPQAAQDFLGKVIQQSAYPFAIIDSCVLQFMGVTNRQQLQLSIQN